MEFVKKQQNEEANKIILYEIIHDKNEIPSLLQINEFSVIDNIYDEEYGAYIMNKYLHLGIMDNEHYYILSVNSNREINGIINISLGSYDNVPVYRRSIFTFLALIGSKGFADYHNHPNNSVKPSSDDFVNYAHMDNIAQTFEIEHLGSYILGRNTYIKIGEDKAKQIEE